MTHKVGLYIHVPFCLSKCPYCDFYSVRYSREEAERYADALIRNIKHYEREFDSVYFGGGTPILLHEHIAEILKAADITEDAEITVEANPCLAIPEFLDDLRRAGVNRMSFGVQSMNADELLFLGRRHSMKQAENAVRNSHDAGFENISADMMIGLPGQTEDKIKHTAEAIAELGVTHISAYILKIEENTPFAQSRPELPDDDRTADLYLYTAELLEKLGFMQYEISNFAKPGYECKHNLKYWRCEEYLGVGPAAHSYFDGKRFCVAQNINAFMNHQNEVITDDAPGGWDEYAMLKFRLTEGITYEEAKRFGKRDEFIRKAEKLPRSLVNITDRGVNLTKEGFIVSNSVISELVF